MSRSSNTSESENMILKIEPSGSSVMPYVLGIILGLALIIITIKLDFKFSTYYYYIALMAIIFYLIIDHRYLQRNKVKLIELKEKNLHIYKGKKMTHEAIQLTNVLKISTKKRFLNRNITLLIETPARKKGITFFISGENFRNADLMKLYEELNRFVRIN